MKTTTVDLPAALRNEGRYWRFGVIQKMLRISRLGTLAAALGATQFLVLPFAAAQAPPKGMKPETQRLCERYTKYEYLVPMRDGKRLFTAVYVPKDGSLRYPILLYRTPYGVSPYGVDQYPEFLGPSREFETSGYIFALQDVRGTFMSEGTFVEMASHIDNKKPGQIDESTDTFDTIEWLLTNLPSHNGKVGMWGISYPGFYTSAGIIDTHPALKAASPQAPMTDLFNGDDNYHGGAFMLAANFDFYSAFKPDRAPTTKRFTRFDYGTPDGYQFYLNLGPLSNANTRYFNNMHPLWNDQLKHDTYDDFWKSRNLAPHLKNIRCAVLTVAGWFDAEDLAGPFLTSASIGRNNPDIFNGLVVGPWSHGGWARLNGNHLGNVTFGSNTAQFFRSNILFPFFEQYLKDGTDARLTRAYVFETGTNVWRQYQHWPPENTQARVLYFHKNGRLSFERPDERGDAFDEYVSDPDKPVPFLEYTAIDVPEEYMVGDQRFASTRPDVLVYQTEILDADVRLVGPVSPHIFVSTTGTDSDWVVKLIDVYPPDYPDASEAGNTEDGDVPPPRIKMGGYQQLVRGEPMRGKFRKSFEKPEPFRPSQVEQVVFEMPDVNHTFRRGHRIMVQVQSSWFPLIDRNPQVFENIPEAKSSDFQKAIERIYRDARRSSGIRVQVLP